MEYDRKLLQAVKKLMIARYPRFGAEIASANLEYKTDLLYHTAATDGKNIYFDPNYLASLSDDDKLFIIAHELMHVKFEHMYRMAGRDGKMRDPEIWNVATDAIINANLERDGFKIKDGYVNMPEALNYSAEEFYEKLLEEKQQKQSQSGNGQNNQQNQGQNDENQQGQENGQDGMQGPQQGQNGEEQGQANKQDQSEQSSQGQNGEEQGQANKRDQSEQSSQGQNGEEQGQANKRDQSEQSSQGQNGEEQGQSNKRDQSKQSSQGQNGEEQGQANKRNQSKQSSQGQNGEEQGQANKQDQSEQSSQGQSGNQQDEQNSSGGQQFADDHSLWEKAFEESKQSNKGQKQQKSGKNQETSYSEEVKDTKFNPTSDLPEFDESKFDEKSQFSENRELRREIARQKFDKMRDQVLQKTESGNIEFGEVGNAKPILDWKLLLRREVEKTETIWSQRRSIAENNYAYRLEENDVEDEAETEVMIDVSGSVSLEMVKAFLRQLKPILKESKLKVGCFNEKFWGMVEIKSNRDIDNFKIPQAARGHSAWTEDWDLAVRSFSKKREVNKIVFTDGEPCPGTMPKSDLKGTNVIWLVYSNRNFSPCCGKVIQISKRDLQNFSLRSKETCEEELTM